MKIKLLFISLLLLFFGILVSLEKKQEPKFKLTQKIKYKVPYFYSLACSGEGEIEGHEYKTTFLFFEKSVYTLYTESPCPTEITEEDIIGLW